MSKRIKRHFLGDKEAKLLLKEASGKLGTDFASFIDQDGRVEVVEAESVNVYKLRGRPLLARVAQTLFPTLLFDEFLLSASKVVVDMGAIPYVCKGANIMAPGIRRIEGVFSSGQYVVIADERHGKAIAVGRALYDSETAKTVKQGPVVENVHFVGDIAWNLMKSLATRP